MNKQVLSSALALSLIIALAGACAPKSRYEGRVTKTPTGQTVAAKAGALTDAEKKTIANVFPAGVTSINISGDKNRQVVITSHTVGEKPETVALVLEGEVKEGGKADLVLIKDRSSLNVQKLADQIKASSECKEAKCTTEITIADVKLNLNTERGQWNGLVSSETDKLSETGKKLSEKVEGSVVVALRATLTKAAEAGDVLADQRRIDIRENNKEAKLLLVLRASLDKGNVLEVQTNAGAPELVDLTSGKGELTGRDVTISGVKIDKAEVVEIGTKGEDNVSLTLVNDEIKAAIEKARADQKAAEEKKAADAKKAAEQAKAERLAKLEGLLNDLTELGKTDREKCIASADQICKDFTAELDKGDASKCLEVLGNEKCPAAPAPVTSETEVTTPTETK